MKQRFDKKQYGQRWQTETVNSMIKRRLVSLRGAELLEPVPVRSSFGASHITRWSLYVSGFSTEQF